MSMAVHRGRSILTGLGTEGKNMEHARSMAKDLKFCDPV